MDEGAKHLMDDVNAKMVEWEGKLVALGNAMDKAKALQVEASCYISFCISSSSFILPLIFLGHGMLA